MKFICCFLFGLSVASGQVGWYWQQFGNDIITGNTENTDVLGISLSSDGSTVAVASREGAETYASVYRWNGSQWQQRGEDIKGGASGSLSLSSNGLVIVIGDRLHDAILRDTGRTRIFEWDGDRWQQRGKDINGSATNELAGESTAINSDGSMIAVGSKNSRGRPFIRVLDWNDSEWQQRSKLTDIGPDVALSSDGSTIAAAGAGDVRMFWWNGSQWIKRGVQDLLSGSFISLSSDGSVMAIGEWGEGIKIYAFNSTQWRWSLTGSFNGDARDRLGVVSLSSDGSVVATASQGGTKTGFAQTYELDGEWQQVGIDIDEESSGNIIGSAVSLSGDGSTLATIASEKGGDGSKFSRVIVFKFSAPLSPVISLDGFYESMSGSSVRINATPPEEQPEGYSYQWYLNDFVIPSTSGGKSSIFTIDGNDSNNGTWRVDVSGSGGTTSHEFEFRVFVDTDGDGLSDYRESNILLTNPSSADTDGDGLDDRVEMEIHSTNPLKADTNEDGFRDGLAVEFGLNPLTDLGAFRTELLEQLKDIRINSGITSVTGSEANLQLVIEESEDLTSWTKRETIDVTIPVEEDEKTKFLRFKIKE